jgi:hypothetical protein
VCGLRVQCEAGCCSDAECVTWQFRESRGCMHGTLPVHGRWDASLYLLGPALSAAEAGLLLRGGWRARCTGWVIWSCVLFVLR